MYLHFETRARLFMCMLMRESLELVDELVSGIRRDPAALLPSEQARLTYLGVVRRPLLQAMFGRDVDLLGDLAHEAAVEPLRALKIDLASKLFPLLREHGLMRTDLDIDTQRYVLSAVQTGFYLYEPDTAVTASPEFAAAALSHTIRQAVQAPGLPNPGALAALAPKVIAMYEQFRADWRRPRGASARWKQAGMISARATFEEFLAWLDEGRTASRSTSMTSGNVGRCRVEHGCGPNSFLRST